MTLFGLGALTVLLCVLGVATKLYVFPDVDRPVKADAIVVLGGLSGNEVVAEAKSLVASGVSDTVIISDSFGANTVATRYCENPGTSIVVCFKADPNTTAGESAMIRRLATANDWKTIVVVTMDYHVSRARYIVGQCFSGTAQFVGASAPMDIAGWAYQFSYQTGAFGKALTEPAC